MILQEKESLQKMSQYTVLMKQFVALNFHRCFCFLTVGLNSQTVWVKWIVWMKKTYQIMSVLWFISYSRRIKEVHLAVKSPVGFSMPCFVKTNRKAEIIEMLCCFYSKYWLHELLMSVSIWQQKLDLFPPCTYITSTLNPSSYWEAASWLFGDQ